ncbi:MAG: hypothetical protein MUO82_00515, partial [Candidatus Thermoplasmatota archaeon]|nr:hypothetical protein [Candidatus Thermoplasmatota archaeon]
QKQYFFSLYFASLICLQKYFLRFIMNTKTYERNRKTILNNFKNENHKKVVLEYLALRETIDKISNAPLVGDMYALLTLSTFLKSKPFDEVTQDDMMEFDRCIQKSDMVKK